MQYNFTIRKKDKGYQIIVSYKDGLKWRQKSKQGFPTQREAKLYGQQIVEELKKTVTNSLDDSLKNITFIELCELYMREKTSISENTKLVYHYIIKNLSVLHQKRVRDISHQVIFKTLSDIKFANRTKNMYITFLKSVFNFAIKPYQIIQFNPVSEIKRFTTKTYKSLTTFTMDEMDLLLKTYIDNKNLYTLLCIARYTGARYGEILALTWFDIDLACNTIRINKQLSRTSNNVYGIKEPKTRNSIRTLPIPPILSNILSEYKSTSNTERLFNVNTSSTGNINCVIKSVVPNKSIHAFRHTYATTLLANGVDIKTVASLLGDNINTVMNVYVHYSDEMRKNAAQDISKIFG